MSALENLRPEQFGVAALSAYYNDIPETRGTPRGKGGYNGPTGRELSDAEKLGGAQSQHPTDHSPSGCLSCEKLGRAPKTNFKGSV